jgi:hypothetical protein
MVMKFLRIIPTIKRFKSWAMPTRFAYVVGIFTIMGFVITAISVIVNTKRDKIIYNSGEDKDKIISSDSLSKDTKKTYRLNGISNLKLKKKLKRITNIDFNNNSNNEISIKYSGSILLLNEMSKSYIFTGGYVIIYVDGDCLHEFTEFIIPPMRPSPKSLILREINSKVSFFVNENVDKVAKQIVICLES